MRVKVVGITYRPQKTYHEYVKERVAQLGRDRRVQQITSQAVLVPEYDNPFDKNAVQVIGCLENGNKHCIGYLPKEVSSELQLKEIKNVTLNIETWTVIGMKTDSYAVEI